MDERRPDYLTPGWRLTLGVVWVATMLAMITVWKTSQQLGISTWWLGPFGDPNPFVVRVLPMVPAALMIGLIVGDSRWTIPVGALGGAAIVIVGVIDLDYIARLGVVEIVVGIAAAAGTLAAIVGRTGRPSADGR